MAFFVKMDGETKPMNEHKSSNISQDNPDELSAPTMNESEDSKDDAGMMNPNLRTELESIGVFTFSFRELVHLSVI